MLLRNEGSKRHRQFIDKGILSQSKRRFSKKMMKINGIVNLMSIYCEFTVNLLAILVVVDVDVDVDCR